MGPPRRRVLENRMKAVEARASKGKDAGEKSAAREEARELARELARTPLPEPPQLIADDVTAESMGKRTAFISSEEDTAADVFTSDWVLVTSRPGFLENEPIKSARSEPSSRPRIRMWTDDYSNLWQIVTK